MIIRYRETTRIKINKKKKKLMEKQDKELDSLGHSLGNLRGIAVAINTELDEHDK